MHWRMVERGMEFGWLFIVIFTILMVLGLIHLVNLISGSRGRETHGESPLYILKRRYAKGEITREEFEKMKDEIAGKIC
jgi:putative membrane protein